VIHVVIVGGDQPRTKTLYSDLIDSGLFHVEIQPRMSEADLVETSERPSALSMTYGRTLSISERCCALAHRLAQEKIRSTGGIILEDDAVVMDYQALADIAVKVVSNSQSVLFNYSTKRCVEDIDWTTDTNRIVRTIGPTALAVGYAASRSELNQLIEANKNLDYVADWPPTRARHLRLRYPIVAHGSINNKSLIECSSNRQPIPFRKLLVDGQGTAAFRRLKNKAAFELTKAILQFRKAEE